MSSPDDKGASPLPPPPQSRRFRTPPRKPHTVPPTIVLSDTDEPRSLSRSHPRPLRLPDAPEADPGAEAVPATSPAKDAPAPPAAHQEEKQEKQDEVARPAVPVFREATASAAPKPVAAVEEAGTAPRSPESSSRKRPRSPGGDGGDEKEGDGAGEAKRPRVVGTDGGGDDVKKGDGAGNADVDEDEIMPAVPPGAPPKATVQEDGPSMPDDEDEKEQQKDEGGNDKDKDKTDGKEGGKEDDEEEFEEDTDEEKPLDKNAMVMRDYERITQHGAEAVRRYEQYRRSDLKNVKVKRVLQTFNPSLGRVSEQYIIAVKGLAKMFVGDVTETALKIKKELGQSGPLTPVHLREAFRQLRRNGTFPSSADRTLSFSR